MLSLQIRSASEIVRDGASLVSSVVRSSLGIKQVSLVVAQANEKKCRTNTCGAFREFENGDPACDKCQCKARGLRAKWSDALAHCPVFEWDNRDKERA
jgi:hypothetical protein